MKGERKSKHSLMSIFMAAAGLVLVSRLFVLTVAEAGKWRSAVEDMSVRAVYETAPRGDILDRNGDIIGSYDKIHLFDVLDAKGDEQESNQITRGDHLLTFDTDFGRVGVMVCYDVRFPEMARTYALAEVEYLMVPAAFFAPRFDHWQQLIGAAALENGMYVMGVNIFGKVCDTLNMCGRSLIVDPWGIQMATAPDKPAFIQAYVDSDYPKQIRDALGTFHNRVPSVYDIK